MKREVCKKCGFKIRGKKHVEGDHHNGKVPRLKGKR